MSEATPPVSHTGSSANQPQPDTLKLQGSRQMTQTSLLLSAALNGVQQALSEAKEQSAQRAKETKETYGQ